MQVLGRGHAILAAPVVYELLGCVVQGARAVFAGEVVAVQFPLVDRRSVDGASTVVRRGLLVRLLIVAFWLTLGGNDRLGLELGSEVLHALVLDLRLDLLLTCILLLLLLRIVLLLRRALIFHAFALVLDVA